MSERYVRHPDLRLADVEGEGVVLHLGTRRYFTVTESGLALLRALETPCTIDELVEVLLERYEVTREQAESSVRRFLETCRTGDLLGPEGGG